MYGMTEEEEAEDALWCMIANLHDHIERRKEDMRVLLTIVDGYEEVTTRLAKIHRSAHDIESQDS